MVEKLKLIRFTLGLSQEEMAKKLSVSQGYYSQIEKGKIVPSDRLKNRIAYVFGLEK